MSEPRPKLLKDGTTLLEHDLTCPDCGGKMLLRSSRFGPFYGCSGWPKCQATHGAHPNGAPLGKPGTKAVKEARILAHAAFDQLWNGGGMKRNEAYHWLAGQLGMPRREVHIGGFDEAQCARVIEVVERFLSSRSAG